MKVLWFANTPCGAISKLDAGIVVGGWLSSLENELKKQKDIELHVVFYWHSDVVPFSFDGVYYYPIHRNGFTLKVASLLGKVTSTYSTYDKICTRKLLSVVEQVKPDLIHIHGTEANFGLVQEECNIPTAISIQGLISPYNEHFFAGVPKSFLKRRLSYYTYLSQKKIFGYFAKREAKSLSMAQYVLGRTDWDRRITKVMSPDSEYFKCGEILRGPFYNDRWEYKSGNLEVMKVATITGPALYKGIELLLKTAQHLKYAGVNLEWNVIGLSRNDVYVSLCENFTGIKCCDVGVVLKGKLDAEEIIAELKENDIYCQVSHIENSPNSLCEAMLLGMPVVATYAGGTDSLCHHGTDSIVVQTGDSLSMAGAIFELASDDTMRRQISQHAHKVAKERHNVSDIVEQLLYAYKAMCLK